MESTQARDGGGVYRLASHISVSPQLRWLGDRPVEPAPWLVQDLVPQKQITIGAGVYSAGKTFVACDLAACVMLRQPFAGREVVRPGGVLWLAAEGANEIDARVLAAVNRIDPDLVGAEVPFACQALEVPRLKDPNALRSLLYLVDQFKAGLKARRLDQEGFAPLSMIVIDTLGSAADFEDGNNSAEAQKVLNMLRSLSDQTEALVFLIDHFGKAVETGIMGASAKAQSADAVLAIMCDKDPDGTIRNRRMAIHKLRGGATGIVTPFTLRPVPIGSTNGTTCIVDWSEIAPAASEPKAPKATLTWTPTNRLFRDCLERTLLDKGEAKRPFGFEGPEVKAVPVGTLRSEFITSYAADTHDAKKKQWARLLKETAERNLVATRAMGEPDPIDWIWFSTKGETGGTSGQAP